MRLVHAVEQALLMAGLGTTASANINGVIWDELRVNAAIGILSATFRLPGTLAT